MKIGILADWLNQGSLEGNLRKAAEMGADGVQLYAVDGELAPENMTREKREALRKLVSDLGLEISALCGDMGEGGFAFEEQNPPRIRRTKAIVDLALDLGCRIVTTHVGVVPHDPQHPRFAVIAKAMKELGDYAESKGAVFAIETGPEPSADLKRLIEITGSHGIGVNMDPANLIMCHNEPATQAVETLKKYIVHTHAKDGRLLKHGSMDEMYGMVPVPPDYDDSEYCVELPLGEGDVNFDTYIPALKAAGYDGYLTIERECGADPVHDIGLAIDFLKKYL